MSNALQNHGPTYYEILGADPMDQLERIEDLFRQLAYEAEQSGDHSRIPQVVDAFKVLRDPTQRHLYDQHLAHTRNLANQNEALGQPPTPVDPNAGISHVAVAQTSAAAAVPGTGTVPPNAGGQLGSPAQPAAAKLHEMHLAAAQQQPPSQYQTTPVSSASSPLIKPADQPHQVAGPSGQPHSLEHAFAPAELADTLAHEAPQPLQETPATPIPTVDTPAQQALSPVDAMAPMRKTTENAASSPSAAGPASSPPSSPPPNSSAEDGNLTEPPTSTDANPGQQKSSSEFCAHTGAQRRRELLAMFYKRRRQDLRAPGIGIGGIDQKVDYDYETLEFHLWYMLEKKWLWREESGMLSITYSGVEQYESDLIEGLA